MKKYLFIIPILFIALTSYGQESKEIVKKGINLGPLPAIAFDADKGFQLGAILNIYDFGDGATYPNPYSQWYMEASFFTKGSQLYVLTFDTKTLIPGVRFSPGVIVVNDKALDFYGFNGYQSYYNYERVNEGKNDPNSYLYSPYYKVDRLTLIAKADFTGEIIKDKLYWEAGYMFSWFKQGAINREKVNKGKAPEKMFPDSEPTLYEQYRTWGIIPDDEDGGGINSGIKLGLMYDTRDVENSPNKGLWIEGHTMLAPKWLGTTNPYYRYSLTFRHYVPIVMKKLTLAYRLNYQGTIGKSAPFYVLPYLSAFGSNYDRDGMGGYRTVRGMMRNRVQALDVGFYNAELRWKFVEFPLFKQNIAFSLTAFSDGAICTRPYNMGDGTTMLSKPQDFATIADYEKANREYQEYMMKGTKESLHATVGAGLRFIMNQNFIVAFEYGKPLNKQDGNGAFYINTGYLF